MSLTSVFNIAAIYHNNLRFEISTTQCALKYIIIIITTTIKATGCCYIFWYHISNQLLSLH